MEATSNSITVINQAFGDSPTTLIRRIETELPGIVKGRRNVNTYLESMNIYPNTLSAALQLKKVVGQINVMIHALGILVSLPHILEEDEIIDCISLGAGNTGKNFDLVTGRRVAEFKFIQWRGGAESIRQNNVFKAFLYLLWDNSGKRRQLFLTGTKEAFSFLQGGRALSSVLSKDHATRTRFEEKYSRQYQTVGQFYQKYRNDVELVDLSNITPVFKHVEISEAQDSSI